MAMHIHSPINIKQLLHLLNCQFSYPFMQRCKVQTDPPEIVKYNQI